MSLFSPICAIGISLGLFMQLPAFAKSEGFHLKAGHATLSQDAHSLVVESCGNAIVEWDSFSLAPSEAIHFAQSDSRSAVLNRVLGNCRSDIFGQIHSNGSVFLINPNGILIGEGAQINTAGFIASSLDVLDADFLAGKALLFSGEGKGSIVNCGTISCPEGNIALLSCIQVENHGTLSAKNGAALLAVGTEILLQPEEAPSILIRAGKVEEGGEEGVSLLNSGTIQALHAELRNGSSVYAMAIQNKGVIEALAVEERGGEVFLVAEQGICENIGTITARNEHGKGGTVHLLGECVGLLQGAAIDVSGSHGGGTILAGGDLQGKNPNILNSQCTIVEEGVSFNVDATENGNGGKAIVWADQEARYFGSITARGGSRSGDGGFVEVSAPHLIFHGIVNALAPCGKTGELLLDPNDIVIDAMATTGSFTGCGAPPSTYTITAGTPTNQILNTDLQTQLAGCNVVISTVGSAGAGPEGGSIRVTSTVTWAAATTLTMTAASFMVIDAAITNSNAGGVNFNAMNFTANGSAGSTHGIAVNAILTTTDGNITLTGTSGTGAGELNGIMVAAQIKSLGATASAGVITLTGTSALGVTGSGRGIRLNTVSAITSVAGAINLSGMSNASGSSAHGLLTALAWTTGTTGDVTFSNCTGGSGATSHGVMLASFTTSGNFTAITNIRGGTGSGCIGYNGNVTSITTAGKSIQITATTNGTGTDCHGVHMASTVTVSGTGNITLDGTASATSTGTSHGVFFDGGSPMSAGSGKIQITGRVPVGASGSSDGFRIDVTFGLVSSSGEIELSGESNASGGGMGVFINRAQNPSITGNFFTFKNCKGSPGTTGHGVHLGATGTLSVGGSVRTSGIVEGRGAGGIGFNAAQAITAVGNIDLTASSSGTGAAHGISLTSGTMSTTGMVTTITLNGTSSTSGTAAHGINISGTGKITSVGGAINITGTAPVGTMGTSNGILLAATDSITSTTGMMLLNGTSNAAGANSHGLSITSSWTTGTTGTLSLTGVAPVGSFPINLGNNLTSSSTIAFNSATGLSATSMVSGNGITFSSTINAATAGTQGLIVSGGTGTAVFSGIVGGTTPLGAISVTANQINVSNNVNTQNGAMSWNSPLVLTGTSTMNSVGAGMGATITFSSTVNATAAGTQSLTLTAGTGNVTFSNTVGAATPLGAIAATANQINVANNITTQNGTMSWNSPLILTGTSTMDSIGAGMGTTITFGSTLNATAAGVQSLTLTAGTGNVTFNGIVGGTNRLNLLTVSSGTECQVNADITANNVTIPVSPVSVMGDRIITAMGP